MNTFNFSANGIDFGNWYADTIEVAQDNFAEDAGYMNWNDMMDRADEFGGNTVEVMAVLNY